MAAKKILKARPKKVVRRPKVRKPKTLTRGTLTALAAAEEVLEMAQRNLEIAGNRVASFEIAWAQNLNAAMPLAKRISNITAELDKIRIVLNAHGDHIWDDDVKIVSNKYLG